MMVHGLVETKKSKKTKVERVAPITNWFKKVPKTESSLPLKGSSGDACTIFSTELEETSHYSISSDFDITEQPDSLQLDLLSDSDGSESCDYRSSVSVDVPKFSDSEDEDMEIESSVSFDLHPKQYIEQHRIIPFPDFSPKWYERQHLLATKNVAREKRQKHSIVMADTSGDILCINRSQTQGSLQDNIKTLSSCETTDSQRKHIEALTAVARYIIDNGPVVKTQEVGRVYIQEKGMTECVRKRSMELYQIFSRHLNLLQIYIYNQAYLVPNTPNVEQLILTLTSIVTNEESAKDTIVREVAESRLKEVYSPALKYMDTHRDQLILKGLMAELTSIRFTSRLQGVSSRKGTRSGRKHLISGLEEYAEIRQTSQMVRNDLTVEQQRRLTEQVISARKLKEIKTIAKGRGRKLKTDQFPELPTVLLYAFGEYNVKEDGGGVEAHPRLTTGTLYRAVDNVMTMKVAREILLSLTPDSFKISLSSCYNYTENYRKGSRQALQHHDGRDINAPLSLRKPPRTGVQQLVVNLHWTTSNVNLHVDSCHDLPNCMVISKDAKAIIPTDISPVQNPGPTWKKRLELPDHTWDQSRTNAITPMTFLFLQTQVSLLPVSTVESFNVQASSTTHLQLTRTGQSVTLLNLSFFEPDTTFKCLNELLYLLTLPALDVFFRDRRTGCLKKQLTFVVDNGPAEQPSSHIVQMCIVRLLNFLKLDKVSQISFAEYHSKRNFVERVHAEENRMLSKHGPFSSKPIHQNASVGSTEHLENMESVAEEVRKCITQGSFGGKQLLCYRGIKQNEYIFDDEKEMQDFLSLSEEGKEKFPKKNYAPRSGSIMDSLVIAWNVDRHFCGEYIRDHQAISNTLHDYPTCWTDKYSTVVYSPRPDIECRRHELQPIPDYLRWFKTNEAHYLPLEEVALLKGDWLNIPAIFLPTKVLQLCFTVVPKPPEHILQQICLLSWLSAKEVTDYKQKLQDQLENQLRSEKEKERWKSHSLYRTNKKAELETLCRKSNIPVVSSLQKHQLVALLAEKQGESPPEYSTDTEYVGNLASIPTTTKAINRLSIPYLKSVLSFHCLPIIGSKEELVLRTYLLRSNRTADVIAREEGQLNDLIRIAQAIISEQRRLSFSSHIYRKRKYSISRKSHLLFIPQPCHICSDEDLKNLFKPFLDFLDEQRKLRETSDKRGTITVSMQLKSDTRGDDLQQGLTQTGSKVKVKWTPEELEGTDWKGGWYAATVNSYDYDTDILTLTYSSEPGIPYEEELLPLLTNNKIKLIWSPL